MKFFMFILLIFSFLIPQEPCEGTCLSEEETVNLFNNIKELEFEVDKNHRQTAVAEQSNPLQRLVIRLYLRFRFV